MRRAAWAWAGAGILAGAGWLWWAQADGAAGASATDAPASALAQAGSAPPASAHAGARPAGADALLAPGLRDALEALLHAAGPARDPGELKQRLESLVARHFAPELAARALALARRYVDYRVALGRLSPPEDPMDPDALRIAMAQLRKLQLQHFSSEEYDALFSAQLQFDQYTLARLDIARQTGLSPEQKRQALAEAEALLPATARAERAESVAHLDAARQTAAFNAQGTDDATRLAQRSALHGAEAAQRMAQLDREERDWNARLDQYQQALGQGLDDSGLQQVRGRLFTPQEQLRIDAALALRNAKNDGTP